MKSNAWMNLDIIVIPIKSIPSKMISLLISLNYLKSFPNEIEKSLNFKRFN